MKQKFSLFLALAILLSLFAGCTTPASPTDAGSETRQIVDMAGRTIILPEDIDSVFPAGPAAAVYLYTLAPDLLLGWNYALNDIEKSIIPEQYHDLPNFGQNDAINDEAVIAANPTIVLNVGTINDKLISDCDVMSQRLGIPVVAVDGDLLSVAEAYRFLGDLFGMEETAEDLAAYAEKTFRDLESISIPEEKKLRVYYGNGQDSLETAPRGSSHSQILDLVRALNVAELELGDGSRIKISPEQLLAWDPDVIVLVGEPKSNTSGSSAAQALMENPLFSTLQAVRNRRVYGIPNAPFNWADRPAGPNRILGIRWLSGLFYPEDLSFDVDMEVKEFFRLFYHVELTRDQLENIYKGIL